MAHGEDGIPFVQKHAPLESVLLPLVSVMMVHTDMAKLIKYGYNGRVPPAHDLDVGAVARGWRHSDIRVSLLGWLGDGWLPRASAGRHRRV